MTSESRLQRLAPIGVALATLFAHVIIALQLPRGGVVDPLAPDATPGWSIFAALAALLPVGDVALQMAMVSAIAAAITAGLLVRLVMSSGQHLLADAVGGVAGAALLASTFAWSLAASTPGPSTVIGALVVAAIMSLDRIAQGGSAAAGVAAGTTIGWLAAVLPSSRVLLVPLAILVVIRVRHGARWPLIVPAVLALAWGMAALVPVARDSAGALPSWNGAASANASPSEYIAILGDQIGPLGLVAACLGALVLAGRGRRSRWMVLSVAALLLGHLVDGDLRAVGPLVMVAVALTTAVAVARLSQMIRPAVGQVCVGLTCAVLVAVPAAFATASVLSARAKTASATTLPAR